ncbi:MAG: hypothetical protein ACYDAY_04885 [Candidatus Dormibacteria bacterium]
MSIPGVSPVALALPLLLLLLAQVNYLGFGFARHQYRRALACAAAGMLAGEVTAAILVTGWAGSLAHLMVLGGLHPLPDALLSLLAGWLVRRVPSRDAA